jgi:hypothetical protein
MSDNQALEAELSTISALKKPTTIEIPNAALMQLQTLDLARHVTTSPDGKRYVVATFDATRMGQKYITVVYPQQANYLTLIRLPVCELDAEQPEDAVQQHIETVYAIQKGILTKVAREVPSRSRGLG